MNTSASTLPADVVAQRSKARGIPLLDLLTVFAILLVVALVSIPRLRSFALRENELDAISMLRALAARPAPNGTTAGSLDLAALVARDTSLARRLEDLTIDPDGIVTRHGYLFDMTMLRAGEPMLRAWPAEHGRTGLGAFVWTPQRGVLGSANQDGRYSGAASAPKPADVDSTWKRFPEKR